LKGEQFRRYRGIGLFICLLRRMFRHAVNSVPGLTAVILNVGLIQIPCPAIAVRVFLFACFGERVRRAVNSVPGLPAVILNVGLTQIPCTAIAVRVFLFGH
jgi:hypothetical protein